MQQQGTRDAEPMTIPNFRQAGIKSTGILLVGASHAHHAAHAKPRMGNASIPSKFECILYSGSKEADGFASRVSRFSDQTADIPGPGHYSSPGSTFNAETHNILAREGKTVTRDARFRTVIPGSGATVIGINSAPVPGPGNYDAHSEDFLAPIDVTNFNRSGTTMAFKTRQTFARNNITNSPGWVDELPVPGPGTYDTDHGKRERRNRKDRGPQKRGDVSAESWSSDGDAGEGASAEPETRWRKVTDAPEPPTVPFSSALRNGAGTDTILEKVKVKVGGEEFSAGRKSLVDDQPFGATSKRFAERVQEKAPPVGQYNPELPASAPAMMSAFRSTSNRPDLRGPARATEDIGPTSYDPAIPGLQAEFGSDHEPGRAFKELSHTRFGSQKNPRVATKPVPGPGAYDPAIKEDLQRVSEPFTVTMGSKTQRPHYTATQSGISPRRLRQYDGLIKGTSTALVKHTAPLQSAIKPPGPAYYDPMSPALQRSFLLNSKKRWIQ
jgi:hypothetical protein